MAGFQKHKAGVTANEPGTTRDQQLGHRKLNDLGSQARSCTCSIS
ncbi:Conserved hypothetical protein [Prochlorococcus marinus str. MIT 9303]|uniref:Uncharacterized protein n=1 Tax=Prochlorococcus marinus (strain MIT 9303) TaxID=59922 RepID=A2CCR4_PROM3|nr:Conserved hypothetical protein [Prochlorococcus marinus str. MIT 9303]